jgi:hypothetical protein
MHPRASLSANGRLKTGGHRNLFNLTVQRDTVPEKIDQITQKTFISHLFSHLLKKHVFLRQTGK